MMMVIKTVCQFKWTCLPSNGLPLSIFGAVPYQFWEYQDVNLMLMASQHVLTAQSLV